MMQGQVLEARRDVSGGYKVDVGRGERVGRVSSEWFSRPDDERYLSLDELTAAVRARSERSHTRVIESAAIEVQASRDNPERLALVLPGAEAPVAPTHWSFGQLASMVGAPAAYLRQLPASLAGINLQYGLSTHRAEQIKTLETDNGRIDLRAVTGPDYGRIHDYELAEAVQRIAGNGTGDTRWKVPGVAEEEAARMSGLFFQTRATAPTVPGMTPPGLTGPAPTPETDPRRAFLNAVADRRTVAPDRIEAPASPWLLQAGSVIPAALITGIRSDLPRPITAQVTQNVYDSPTGSLLLIPQGTRLIGAYDAGVTFGQRRVLLVWTRLIFPDGRSLVLERQPGADTAGYAGLEDRVDYHWANVLRAAGLSTLLAIGAELAVNEEDRLARAIRDGAVGTINEAGQRIVERQLEVPPTLTIRPGFPVRVLVTRDLVIAPQ